MAAGEASVPGKVVANEENLRDRLARRAEDFVSGEIKSVDAPKLAVLRSDNVTQTIKLNEDTSLRKGREAITMVDIQPGDHVFARGGLENNVFVPKDGGDYRAGAVEADAGMERAGGRSAATWG